MQAQKVVPNKDVPPAFTSINVPQVDSSCHFTQQSSKGPNTNPPSTSFTKGTIITSESAIASTQSTSTTASPPAKPLTTALLSTTHKPHLGLYNYNEILRKSILFYEAQRSGKLPVNNRVPWRKDSALNDRGQNGEDLTGGWYDAGDYVKFGFPMASSATVLAWGLVEYRKAYESAGELNNMLDSIKWATDYFVKAHTGKYEFYGQVKLIILFCAP